MSSTHTCLQSLSHMYSANSSDLSHFCAICCTDSINHRLRYIPSLTTPVVMLVRLVSWHRGCHLILGGYPTI